MAEQRSCQRRRLRSFTDGSLFSQEESLPQHQVPSPDETVLEHEDDLFRRLDRHPQCSGSWPRNLCTKSSVDPMSDSPPLFRHQHTSSNGQTRLRRSISLPANLHKAMMAVQSTLVVHKSHGLNRVAENLQGESSFALPSSSGDGHVIGNNSNNADPQENNEPCADTSEMEAPVEEVSVPDCVAVASDLGGERLEHSSNRRLTDLIEREAWSEVERLCEEEPDAVRQDVIMLCQGEKCQALCLHVVCNRRDTPVSVVDALVTAYPPSVLIPERRRGRLAMHMATLKGASPAVVRYLARAMPQCLQVQDAEGNLPVHYAAMCGTNQVVDILLEAHADSCKVFNRKSKLPLHVLCTRWVDHDDESENPVVSIDTLRAMIMAYPDSVAICDARGRLPLHVACNMAHPRLDVIRLLLSYKPETILSRDEDKCTPLQLAKRFCALPDNDLGVAFLQDVTHRESQRQKKKAAKRMARRLLHLGRKSNNHNNSKHRNKNNSQHHVPQHHHEQTAAESKLFNC